MQQSLGRVNDCSVYKDLIAAQKAAHILGLPAASQQPGVNAFLPETLPLFSPCSAAPSLPLSLLILF